MSLYTNDMDRMDTQDEEEQQDYHDQQLDNLSRGLRGLNYSWEGILLPASPSCSYQTQPSQEVTIPVI
ncbi:hypothetical protein N7478_001621 [Penicillium angulare]|uniref:uncharacterized protein n=1 Tax=Penicillium angulare TaxID=116970 RepID=UPI0025414C7F|nr:uncharacterized protein N7478_001621 [Penicillium angulare]KAJ5288591.1 hypothetical protein N7478_001621 [Penicillium angulare]